MLRVLTFGLVAALAAGCGGAPTVSAPSFAGAAARTAGGAHRAGGAASSDPWMYVSGGKNSVVAVYDMADPLNPSPLGTITDGVSQPDGLFLDAAGTLYVANETGTVTIYPPGATSPALTLSQGLERPTDVTTDASGNVYVANRGFSPNIVVYGPGQSTPLRTITDPAIRKPVQLLFDPAGNMFYSDVSTGVYEVKAGSSEFTQLFSGSALGIALNAATGILYVELVAHRRNDRPIDKIFAFGGHGSKKEHHGGATLAFGCIGRGGGHAQRCIWEPELTTNQMWVYQTNKKAGKLITVAGIESARGVAIKPAGMP